MQTRTLRTLRTTDLEGAAREAYLRAAERGATQAEMAEAAGVPESTICMWLNGYRPLKKLAVLDALLEGVGALP